MRLALILALFPLPAAAWEFSPDPICTLRHQTQAVDFVITHDVSQGLYTLSITQLADTWQPSPGFAITYSGALPTTIETTRHTLSDGGKTLSVSDSGFGNVLNGLEFNQTATAKTATQSVDVQTRGIAAPMAAFRACPTVAPATS